MVELFILYSLAKKLGDQAEAKGRGRFGYQLLLWLFWFGGEFCGAMFGGALAAGGGDGEPNMILVYACALIGAVVGAFIAFAIVGSLPDRNDAPLGQGSYGYRKSDGFPGFDHRGDRAEEPEPSVRDERIRRADR
jgi:hypothetical protein